MKTYLSSLKSMYENAVSQNSEIYDIAAELTDDFRNITAQAILADSRIIKTLRYAIAPSISQMKFGQFFGINSIDKYENDKVSSTTNKYQNLKNIADKIASFATSNIDESRFIWRNDHSASSNIDLAKDYAKKWTCSIAADQNAQTRYRNWRKDQQELSIANQLVELGYVKSSYSGVVKKQTDINIGEYTQELKVKGRTTQKADVIVRSNKNKKIVLIEAKTVGAEIDSTKRIKECCDKANDWGSSIDLNEPIIVSVIASFFTERGISNLKASNVNVIWEHRLQDLKSIL
ncbi:MAG: XamI family restriction endonuclease [Proteobacteria bacterium]|nr:XamI family restriction endonuclease [Pseudomonadota bacterium]